MTVPRHSRAVPLPAWRRMANGRLVEIYYRPEPHGPSKGWYDVVCDGVLHTTLRTWDYARFRALALLDHSLLDMTQAILDDLTPDPAGPALLL